MQTFNRHALANKTENILPKYFKCPQYTCFFYGVYQQKISEEIVRVEREIYLMPQIEI